MSVPREVWDRLEAHAGATADFRMKLFSSGKSPAAISPTDVVRFKLKPSADAAPQIELSTIAPLAGGSVVTVVNLGIEGTTPAEVKVRLAQADTLGLTPGEWWGILGLVDDSETGPDDAFKVVGEGPILLKPAPGGSLGLS
jgi:hypothetical protein